MISVQELVLSALRNDGSKPGTNGAKATPQYWPTGTNLAFPPHAS